VNGSIAPFVDPGLYDIWVSMRPGRHAREATRILDREFKKLRQQAVPAKDLERGGHRKVFQEASALAVSQRLTRGRWFTRVIPRLRSSRTAGVGCAKSCSNPSVSCAMAQVGAMRSRA